MAATASTLGLPRFSFAKAGTYATAIDITKCDGCKNEKIPRCVEACRVLNEKNFPVPRKPIKPLWPQKTFDDWSEKKDVTDILTPYNWIIIQKTVVEGQEIFIPRRCMHCDNPPCANLCPFGALDKYSNGAVVINHSLCLGGAKCKTVCPWHIPQRQSGVGIYMKIQPIPAGGGVMYKCDLCHQLVRKGGIPACVQACEERLKSDRPLFFGRRDEILKMAHKRAEEIKGFIYGEKENGGTATIYISQVSFEKLDASIREEKSILLFGNIKNRLEEVNAWAGGFILGPVALVAGAVGLAIQKRKQAHAGETDGR